MVMAMRLMKKIDVSKLDEVTWRAASLQPKKIQTLDFSTPLVKQAYFEKNFKLQKIVVVNLQAEINLWPNQLYG